MGGGGDMMGHGGKRDICGINGAIMFHCEMEVNRLNQQAGGGGTLRACLAPP